MRNRPFRQALDQHFPEAMPVTDYLASTAGALAGLGFKPDNSLVCVAACRDEIATPLFDAVGQRWGTPFSLVSLAGMLTAGRTGLAAAAHHAPTEAGRRRMVFYAMPHIGISEAGTIGEVQRPGVSGPSKACGALHALHGELTSGSIAVELDRLDAEQCLLTARLRPAIDTNTVPSLVDLVHLSAQAIEDDLWELFQQVADPSARAIDAALFTAVQVHGPGGTNYIWPRSGYVLVEANTHTIDHRPAPNRDRGTRTRKWLARGAAASTAAVLLNARQWSVSPRVGLGPSPSSE